MFLQIHTLTSYHASLLNRDDAGLAKRIPFGGVDRLRISSQCLKRHWRIALQRDTALPSAVRSRQFFGRVVLKDLVAGGVDQDIAHALVKQLVTTIIDGGLDDEKTLSLKQPIMFGRPEAEFFVKILQECADAGGDKAATDALKKRLKEGKKNYRAMIRQAGADDLFAGLEGAMFGRFVTSDILARTDAAVHVAHSFTVHALATEVDYFTVVDDLNLDDETGAAHAGDMELGAGVYYGYVVVDVPLLVSNITGCDPAEWHTGDGVAARSVLKSLVDAIATVSPGAKLGATAPYAYSDLVLLEAGRQQPRSLANAFLAPIDTRGGAMSNAAVALDDHIQAIDRMYGPAEVRRALATTLPWRSTPDAQPLPEVIEMTLEAIFGR